MLNFIKNLTFFLIPIGLIFAFPIIVFVLSKEYYSSEDALHAQMKNQKALIGFAYSSDNAGIKKELVIEKDPVVFALGDSRTGEFRKEFFNDTANFVTASNGVGTIEGMKKFIEELPEKNKTKLVILAIDPAMFLGSSQKENPNRNRLLLAESRQVYKDYFSKKFSLHEFFEESKNTKNIGLRAIINKDGFRSDGSERYGKILTNSRRLENLQVSFFEAIVSVQKNRASSEYDAPVQESTLSSLNRLLTLCKKRNIYVIGFLRPHPSVIYQEITRINDPYSERELQLPKTVSRIFSEYGFDYYNFSDISVIGKYDTEFVDSGHATDKFNLRMVIYMAERNKQLAKYVDIAKDKELLKNTKRDFIEDDI